VLGYQAQPHEERGVFTQDYHLGFGEWADVSELQLCEAQDGVVLQVALDPLYYIFRGMTGVQGALGWQDVCKELHP
jgi:predicted component of type VI protein secretion system